MEREEMKEIRQWLVHISQQMTGLQQEVSGLTEDLSSLRTSLENTTNRHIQLLLEGHEQLSRRLDTLLPLSNTVEDMKLTVDVLEHVAHRNSSNLKKVKLLK